MGARVRGCTFNHYSLILEVSKMNGIDAIAFRHGGSGSLNLGYNYLRSPKGLYFGQLNLDGKFSVYKGASPEDQHDVLWSTDSQNPPSGSGLVGLGPVWAEGRGSTQVHLRIYAERREGNYLVIHNLWESGSFHFDDNALGKVVLEDDGNFCVYKISDDPNNPRLWQSGVTDPVVDYEISKLDFDIKAAKFINSLESSIDSGTAENQSDAKDVTLEISGEVSTAITEGWSDSLAIKVGVKTSYKTGIPVVAETSVEVSLEVQNTYTWNGSTTDTRKFSWKVTPKAGPWERAKAQVYCTTSKIEVPYTLTGELIFKSGKRMMKKIDGIYTGSNSHNVRAVYTVEKMRPESPAQMMQPEPIVVTVKYIKV